MSYCKRTVLYPGKGRGEQEVYYSSRRFSGKKCQRGINVKKTRKEVERINEIHAEDRLRWLINTNFGKGDLHFVLTYRQDARPELMQSKELVQGFLVRLRRLCKKQGIELKYIWTTERGKRGAIHHHFLMPYIDIRQLQELWPHGMVRIMSTLDASGEYGGLAHYLIKETKETFRRDDAPHKRRYNASRNLTQPVIVYERIHAKQWNPNPKNTREYDVIPGTVVNGLHGRTGTPYRYFQFRTRDSLQLTARRRP